MESILLKGVGILLSGLKFFAGSLAGRVLAALGLTFVTYKAVMPMVKAWLTGYLGQLDPRVVNFFAAVGLDVCMTLILSAIVARYGMRAVLAATENLQEMIANAGG